MSVRSSAPAASSALAVADGRVWACPTCGDDREFVQPPCVDGHTEDGGECPEWACTDCGTALVTGAGVDVEAVSAGRGA